MKTGGIGDIRITTRTLSAPEYRLANGAKANTSDAIYDILDVTSRKINAYRNDTTTNGFPQISVDPITNYVWYVTGTNLYVLDLSNGQSIVHSVNFSSTGNTCYGICAYDNTAVLIIYNSSTSQRRAYRIDKGSSAVLQISTTDVKNYNHSSAWYDPVSKIYFFGWYYNFGNNSYARYATAVSIVNGSVSDYSLPFYTGGYYTSTSNSSNVYGQMGWLKSITIPETGVRYFLSKYYYVYYNSSSATKLTMNFNYTLYAFTTNAYSSANYSQNIVSGSASGEPANLVVNPSGGYSTYLNIRTDVISGNFQNYYLSFDLLLDQKTGEPYAIFTGFNGLYVYKLNPNPTSNSLTMSSRTITSFPTADLKAILALPSTNNYSWHQVSPNTRDFDSGITIFDQVIYLFGGVSNNQYPSAVYIYDMKSSKYWGKFTTSIEQLSRYVFNQKIFISKKDYPVFMGNGFVGSYEKMLPNIAYTGKDYENYYVKCN